MKWAIWGLAALFYFYEYVIRVTPSLMQTELMRSFQVSAFAFGNISAFYFYAYAPMQLPVGMLMDRFGARKLLTLACVLCGLGGLLFGLSVDIWMAEWGRFLMGSGSAFAFVGLLFISYHWFSATKVALLIGLGNSIGMLGAFGGEGPLSLSVIKYGWRPTMIVLAIAGFVLGFVIYLFIRNEPPSMKLKNPKKQAAKDVLQKLGVICKNPYSWINALVALFFLLTTGAFAGLWSTPFLAANYGLTVEVAAFAGSIFFLGWIVGGPLIGHFSDRIKQRRPLLMFFTLLGAALLCLIIYGSLSKIWIYWIMFFAGFCCSCQLLTYSLAMEINPKSMKGTAAAMTNFITFIGIAIIQPLIGFLLDLQWDGKFVGGVPIYSAANYRIAMTIFPVALVCAFIFTLFLKKGKVRQLL